MVPCHRRDLRGGDAQAVRDFVRFAKHVADDADSDFFFADHVGRGDLQQARLREREEASLLLRVTLQVVRGEGVDAERLDAQREAPLEHIHELVRAVLVPARAVERPRLGEASVPVHHDGDVLGRGAARAEHRACGAPEPSLRARARAARGEARREAAHRASRRRRPSLPQRARQWRDRDTRRVFRHRPRALWAFSFAISTVSGFPRLQTENLCLQSAGPKMRI